MRIIAGTFKNRRITAPKGMSTRPTSEKLRETLFNICQNYIDGAEFLDLFAGSGAMGIEALSRGAVKATFVDNKAESIQCIKQNLQDLNLQESSQVFKGEIFTTIKKFSQQFDIIYADPPYDLGYGQRIFDAVDQSNLLRSTGFLFIEEGIATELPKEGKTLKLQGSRRAGRALLYQYLFK